MELDQPVQTNIYESNIDRKDLSWLYLNDELRVQGKASEEATALYTRFYGLV